MAQSLCKLDPASGVPFYRHIIEQVLLAVGDGRLKPGERLPTVRALAVDLAVNLNTVAKAYKEMEIRGIVETQQGTGTFIAAKQAAPKAKERKKAVQELADRFVALATARGIGIGELIDALSERASQADRRS